MVGSFAEVFFTDDVIAVEHRTGSVAADAHGRDFRNARANHVPNGSSSEVIEDSSHESDLLTGVDPRTEEVAYAVGSVGIDRHPGNDFPTFALQAQHEGPLLLTHCRPDGGKRLAERHNCSLSVLSLPPGSGPSPTSARARNRPRQSDSPGAGTRAELHKQHDAPSRARVGTEKTTTRGHSSNKTGKRKRPRVQHVGYQ